MPEAFEITTIAALGGLLIGLIVGRWMANSYWLSKAPDSAGWRTAVCVRGRFYYVLTEHEYNEIGALRAYADASTAQGS